MDDALFDIDVAGQLPANRFSKPGYTFAGWAPSASVGGAISDGAWVTNLCAKDVDGNILLDANGSPTGLTLTARWIDDNVSAHDVAVTVGIDNSAAKGFASRLTLVDGETSFAPFEEKADASEATYYALKREGALPAGTYMLMLDGKDTGKTVEVGDDADVVSLNLYSLATSCDSKLACRSRCTAELVHRNRYRYGVPGGIVCDSGGAWNCARLRIRSMDLTRRHRALCRELVRGIQSDHGRCRQGALDVCHLAPHRLLHSL